MISTDSPVLVFIPNGVGDQQQDARLNHTEGLPAQFAALDAIPFGEGEGVGECPHGDLEAHPVLARIARRLDGVPFEPYHQI